MYLTELGSFQRDALLYTFYFGETSKHVMNKVSHLCQVCDSTILYTQEIALYGSSEMASQIGIYHIFVQFVIL
jgi:hypothetical protein